MNEQQTLREALSRYDREALRPDIKLAEQERQQIVERFPLDDWPELPLERYALGQGNKADRFCWWLEFGGAHIGSMKGGSARKHIIYRKQDGTWFFDRERYHNEQEAWQAVRAGFVEAFHKANTGDWDAIDRIEAISSGPALRAKALHCYFPAQLLPVTSVEHIRHFLEVLGVEYASEGGSDVVRLNRLLLDTMRRKPEFSGWSTQELTRFLYHWADPRDQRRIVKIAPGENARFWEECLKGGYICAGWNEMGDLSEFDSKESFHAAFAEACAMLYNGNKAKTTKKARELWTLRELGPGDLVVANQGIDRVLAVGEVVEPGYEYHPEKPEYRHHVRVKWDTSFAQDIPPQKSWAFVTVADIPQALAVPILSKTTKPSPGPRAHLIDPVYREIADALDRKGQVILYGPPGTGKTYTARRFAVWWLMKTMGEESADLLVDRLRFSTAMQQLTAAPDGRKISPLTCLTFHASYSYEDFIEGFRPRETPSGNLALRLEDGIFKQICREAQAHPDQPYVVLIDEINRANIAKVFGELITLLEKDKRGMPIALPQSKQAFTIPPNVYVVGTMNTADRSIKLLDTALRRRFAFLELMPDSTLLQGGKIGNLLLDEFLDELNRRIAEKEGREKQIGHSFLLDGSEPVSDLPEFSRRFRQEILPLLQEYCYDDYRVLADYIGGKLVDKDAQVLDNERLSDPETLVSALEEAFVLKGADE